MTEKMAPINYLRCSSQTSHRFVTENAGSATALCITRIQNNNIATFRTEHFVHHISKDIHSNLNMFLLQLTMVIFKGGFTFMHYINLH